MRGLNSWLMGGWEPQLRSISHCYDNELIRYADSVLGGRAQLIVLVDSRNYLFADLIWRLRCCRCCMICVGRHVYVCVCVCVWERTLCNPPAAQTTQLDDVFLFLCEQHKQNRLIPDVSDGRCSLIKGAVWGFGLRFLMFLSTSVWVMQQLQIKIWQNTHLLNNKSKTK